ncbi:MAG TPA: methyltransferase domain-containing protein [Pirellulales bacterium]|nr:methyltransferase domain-containing protein [Pirellulales bacterium]
MATSRRFDVITLRMVAEHIVDPTKTLAALSRFSKPRGRVVIYTVNRWSPLALAAWLVPFRLHNPVKRVLWKTEPEDTFPVAYRLNTRATLSRRFADAGFREALFTTLADCRVFFRFRGLRRLELGLWLACQAARIPYPESCLLAVYERA